MSDEARTPEEKPELAAVPEVPAISEQFLNKAEFHQEVGYLKGSIDGMGAELRSFVGWLMLTFGLLAVLIGFMVMARAAK